MTSRDIPVIFSAPMVRALIEGRKTMTRRLAWRDAKFGLQDYASEQLEDMELRGWDVVGEGNDGLFRAYKPTSWQRVRPGDRLWVRENYAPRYFDGGGHAYGADWTGSAADVVKRPKWTSCIHMPRIASRLTLIVTAAKTEKLQEIPLRDVWNEGCEVRQFWLFGADGPERQRIGANVFGALWSELHGAESWKANPEVVALTFRVVAANIDSKEAQP